MTGGRGPDVVAGAVGAPGTSPPIDGSGSPSPGAAEVRLSVPAEARYLRLPRMAGAGLVADLGLDLQQVEDVRVAIDELCAAVVEEAPAGARLNLVFRTTGATLEVEGEVEGTFDLTFCLHPVARSILDIVAASYRIDQVDGRRTFGLVARAPIGHGGA